MNVPPTTPTPQQVNRVLRKEMTDFLVHLTTAQPGWPAIPGPQFIEALADSLIEMGKRNGKGVAYLQTLVHDLQDRVNQELSPKV